MDNIGTIIIALLAAAFVGFIIYRVARSSGSTNQTGYTKPRGSRDFDQR